MDEAINVGLAILELNKFHLYETYFDKLQPFFGLENLQLHFIGTDGRILSMKTENIIRVKKFPIYNRIQ